MAPWSCSPVTRPCPLLVDLSRASQAPHSSWCRALRGCGHFPSFQLGSTGIQQAGLWQSGDEEEEGKEEEEQEEEEEAGGGGEETSMCSTSLPSTTQAHEYFSSVLAVGSRWFLEYRVTGTPQLALSDLFPRTLSQVPASTHGVLFWAVLILHVCLQLQF